MPVAIGSNLKRLEVKYIRDYIKRMYKDPDKCYICGSKENRELHHIMTVSELWEDYKKKHEIVIKDPDHIMSLRSSFYKEYETELHNDNLYTLCKRHHLQLHTIYGQTYSNKLVPKIKRWLERQREKHNVA